MRHFSLAVCLLLCLIGPAFAAGPSEKQKTTASNAMMLFAAEQRCPKYRINYALLMGVLSENKVKMADIVDTYSEQFTAVKKLLSDSLNTPERTDLFCGYMWDTFGEGAEVGGLLKRRD